MLLQCTAEVKYPVEVMAPYTHICLQPISWHILSLILIILSTADLVILSYLQLNEKHIYLTFCLTDFYHLL